jgi:DNA-binding transcriptional regulator YiaG
MGRTIEGGIAMIDNVPESERIVVTEENFGELLLEALQQAVAFKEGDRSKARVHVRYATTTARKVDVEPPPRYDAERVRSLRSKLDLSQAVFARALNVSDKTVKAWEQGSSPPSGATLRLLEMVEEHPETFLAKVRRIDHRGIA